MSIKKFYTFAYLIVLAILLNSCGPNSKFNQNLSSWNVSNVTNCGSFANKTPDWNLPKPNFTNCSSD